MGFGKIGGGSTSCVRDRNPSFGLKDLDPQSVYGTARPTTDVSESPVSVLPVTTEEGRRRPLNPVLVDDVSHGFTERLRGSFTARGRV